MTKHSPLASLSATRGVLDAFGLAAKHSLGQNFLVNDGVVGKILTLASVEEGDCIVEVGPGIGTLTTALLGRGANVISVEFDPDLPRVLAQTCAEWADNFTLVQHDALRMTRSEFEECTRRTSGLPTKLVANLPYEIASTLVLRWFQDFAFLESATVMVQREVAERMMAKPGTKDYGAYTVKLQLLAQPASWFAVAPSNFFPAPRVQSAVLRLNRAAACASDGTPLSVQQLESVAMIADAAFCARRKTLANSCKAYFAGKGANAGACMQAFERACEETGIAPTRRGETLSVSEFIALGCRWNALRT